ncbi:hypothetical protein RHGRI_035670 [Rhododendron griersonianum]|uniref:Uncharacterized protein n=1 Tax=Rhododendron griersonianum TaxID=479676 RepID=A0AAV6HQB5_9ERIC|nr:hypothetical protein RHGRI_035670 [Rhododendron griersonianum]
MNKIESREPDGAIATEDGPGVGSDGAKPMLSPGAKPIWSGFGGLGLEGMVGGEERGGIGRNEGAYEIVEMGKASSSEDDEKQPKPISSIVMGTTNVDNIREAIM